MTKTAIVTGVSGQDGSYLSEFLLSKDEYSKVVGLYRRTSHNHGLTRVNHLLQNPNFIPEEADLTDPHSISLVIKKYLPDEFYNLAAQSHVGTSFKQPNLTFSVNTGGVINIIEAILQYSPKTKFYQASTSEMFGQEFSVHENYETSVLEKYQNENTPFKPQSPYGASKLAAHNLVRIYREGYNMFGSCGILFNHESPRRGVNFVTKKITNYIGKLQNGLINEKLKLGNLNSFRDWGHAKDYVRAMWMMLQYETPEDFVIATGETHSIKEFLEIAFGQVNKNYKDYVETDSSLYRPAEVDFLLGKPDKACHLLGWEPQISFNDLVSDMLNYDIKYYANAKNK